MIEPESDREARQRSYRLSLIGFAMMAAILVAGCIHGLASLFLLFAEGNPNVGRWLGVASFDYYFATSRHWTRLASAIFLFMAWSEPTWRRRAGLLLTFSLVDLVLWGVEYGERLNLLDRPAEHEILRSCLATAIGWAKFGLVAGLAADFSSHAGIPQAREIGRAACRTAMTGAALWFAFFVSRVDWSRPWPLGFVRWMPREAMLLMLAVHVLIIICAVQTSLLSLLAARSAAVLLGEIRAEDQRVDDWSRATPEAASRS